MTICANMRTPATECSDLSGSCSFAWHASFDLRPGARDVCCWHGKSVKMGLTASVPGWAQCVQMKPSILELPAQLTQWQTWDFESASDVWQAQTWMNDPRLARLRGPWRIKVCRPVWARLRLLGGDGHARLHISVSLKDSWNKEESNVELVKSHWKTGKRALSFSA